MASLFLTTVAGHAATAQVRLYCLSLKCSQFMDDMLPPAFMDLTSTGVRDAGLGELAPPMPVYEPPVIGYDSYGTHMIIDDGVQTLFGNAYLSIPPLDDADGNRYPDVFEIAKPVNCIRPYCMMEIYGYGTVYPRVTWTRAAGSKNGLCTIEVKDGYFGTFRAPFETIEYTGTLTYTPGSPVVSGTITLSQTGASTNTISGPISFVKTGSDPYNTLTNVPGTWTGTALVNHSFTNHWFSRDINWPKNYAGLIEFTDGDPWSYDPYANWVLSISDLNDSDNDGIPDFSDDANGGQPPRAPLISLAKDASGVQITISGDVGHMHQIEEATSLTSPDWQPVQSVNLGSDPQTVTLTVPAGPRFWRVVAQ